MRRVTLALAVLLAGCSTAAQGSWVLDEFTHEGTTIPIVADVTLVVEGDHASGASGCNTYFGEVTTEDGALVVENVAVTEMFCEDTDVMALEARYLDVLVTERWQVTDEGGRLTLVAETDDEPSIALPTTLGYRSAP